MLMTVNDAQSVVSARWRAIILALIPSYSHSLTVLPRYARSPAYE